MRVRTPRIPTRSLTAGELLRDARKKLGLLQHEAAGRVGVAHSSFASYEQGKVVPGLAIAKRIEKIFGVPLTKWA